MGDSVVVPCQRKLNKQMREQMQTKRTKYTEKDWYVTVNGTIEKWSMQTKIYENTKSFWGDPIEFESIETFSVCWLLLILT